jgi:hypothetical protein
MSLGGTSVNESIKSVISCWVSLWIVMLSHTVIRVGGRSKRVSE